VYLLLLLLLQVVSFKYQVGDKWFLSREDAAAADNQVGWTGGRGWKGGTAVLMHSRLNTVSCHTARTACVTEQKQQQAQQ
jgi:hypothetical protein